MFSLRIAWNPQLTSLSKFTNFKKTNINLRNDCESEWHLLNLKPGLFTKPGYFYEERIWQPEYRINKRRFAAQNLLGSQ
jgi:hypothetical protein